MVLQSCKWHKWYEKQFHHFWIFQDWYCLILEWIYMTTKMLLNFLRVFTQHRIPSNSWILHSKNTLLLSESHPLEHFCANTMMWKSITESLNCSSDIYRVGAGVCCWVDIPIYCCWHSYPFHLLFIRVTGLSPVSRALHFCTIFSGFQHHHNYMCSIVVVVRWISPLFSPH